MLYVNDTVCGMSVMLLIIVLLPKVPRMHLVLSTVYHKYVRYKPTTASLLGLQLHSTPWQSQLRQDIATGTHSSTFSYTLLRSMELDIVLPVSLRELIDLATLHITHNSSHTYACTCSCMSEIIPGTNRVSGPLRLLCLSLVRACTVAMCYVEMAMKHF